MSSAAVVNGAVRVNTQKHIVHLTDIFKEKNSENSIWKSMNQKVKPDEKF